MSFKSQVSGFQRNFWIANIMEMFERLAFFSVRAVLPLWMVATADKHGLALTFTEKGLIFGVWAACQSLIPMLSGSFADNFGYKRSLYIAFTTNVFGYILMANATGFWSMMVAGIAVGTGTAIFKPPIQGTVASSVTEENSSVGYGIFTGSSTSEVFLPRSWRVLCAETIPTATPGATFSTRLLS